MEVCNRNEHDEGVNIRELERYAADHGQRPAITKPFRPERIAVVGSGPGGLSATYHLARLGYPVTLLEADKGLGGVMRTGIPSYRLPRDVLDCEISHIVRHGVDVRTETHVGREELLGLSHEFAAVFVATGLQNTRGLNLGESTAGMVEEGIDFLDRVRLGKESLLDMDVVVVGGGNTAVDAARSALRVGARSVRIVYRRTRAEMPAIKEEIDEALEEGIVLDELVMPLRLRCESASAAASGTAGARIPSRTTAAPAGGRYAGTADAAGAPPQADHGGRPLLTCQRMELGEPDESGRPRPIPAKTEDAQFDIRCDRVLLALGQSADLSILPEGSQIKDDQTLLGLSGAPIFAGGDFAVNEGTVTAAIGSGRRAAWHIHRTLTGEDLFAPPQEPVATPERITMHIFSHSPREDGATIDPKKRRRSFTEVRLGLIDEPAHNRAVEEARRCFSCGVCNQCDRCITHCPEGIVVRSGDEYCFDYDYCKGCGICASQCPRGVIFMAEL
jgi:NADPH-dependent glutamate synthase beta subunit-like oxidoreductase/Pyruvate/2-oxoacid:ferredoxin oxidoreductase delta subunit